MGSPKPRRQAYIPPPAPVVPRENSGSIEAVAEASRKARTRRSTAGGYGSTILTGGLGVVGQAETRTNILG